MGKCKIDPNNPKGAKCLKRFTVKCVGKECKNYAETNFERITASPEALTEFLLQLITDMCNDGIQYSDDEDDWLDWLDQL